MKTLQKTILLFVLSISAAIAADRLSWEGLPQLPNELGVAGPFAGVHNDALIVAGGANFPQPVWENEKVWHDDIFVLTKSGDKLVWKDGGKLAQRIAYGAAVSTPDGVVCMGGNDAESTFDDVFLLSWDASAETVTTTKYPSLPKPCAYGAATLVGDVIYLAGGQNGQSLETAMTNFWALDLSKKGNPAEFVWQELPAWPGPSRALNLTVHQHNGTDDCVYVISGRRQKNTNSDSVEFLKDVWEYTLETREWRKRADAPRCVMAGTAIGHGRNQILVLGGADGSLFFMGDELKDEHPGFPKKALTYDTVDDRWSEAGTTPRNHVTTIVVEWDGAIIIPSGEVRPRVRSRRVWRVTSPAVADVETTDVCVYGGTSGGVVAAVQAARMGKRVVLVEPGRHLGGMMAGGLSWSDVGSAERAKLFGGLAREVFQRIGKHYGQDPEKVFEIAATKIEGRSTGGVDFIRPPSLAFEPKVAERAFNELVREAGVKVLLESRTRSVVKDGRRIVRIELEDGGAVTAKMFIDATYEGDLMALAGVSYTVGRESNDRYNETMNGVRGPEHGPSSGRFPVKVDPFLKPGDPASGLLHLIAGGAPEPLGSADKRIQSYNFRLCLTDEPANRAPLEPPADYDPAQWELLGRYVVAMTNSGRKLTLRSFCKYDPLPNRKFDFNNRWPISTDMLGGAHGWPDGTANERARIAKAHEDYLRGLFHFLRTDPRVPANVREETARFGLPKDEFTDNGNWPHQIYVREARRMVSDFVMTEHHIRNREIAPNGISLATYPMDIHAVRRVYHEGKLYNEGFGGGGGRPAPIGYGAIVPKAAECENLFVTFALSASHAAFGSIRMEPVFMVSSQSAATAACLAIDGDTSVQEVDQAKLRTRLLADGQILAASSTPAAASNPKIVKANRLPGIVMDDDKAEYQGDWMLSNAQPTPIGGYYRHDGNTDRGKKSATFTATVPKAGDYEIRFLYSPHDNRSTKTKVTVTGAGDEKTFRINQREPVLKDGVPNALGVFRIEAGAKVRVTVSNEGADSYVVVDGLQILPVEIAREERAGKRPSGYAMSEPPAQSAPSATPRRKPLEIQPVKSTPAAEVKGKTYDVVVIGGTPGGIACAVRAAREGLTVLLVQHNQHIGGMLTNGLMQWDALYGGPRSPIFNEYAKSIEDYYRETYGPDSPQFRKARYTQQHYPMSLFECGVAEHLFNGLVSAEANITTLLSHYPAEIQREGAALKTLTLREYGTKNDITVTGAAYVDATYEGDLAALAEVPYRVGREGRDEYDEPHAGKLFTNISKEAGSQDAKVGKLNLRLYGHSQGTVDPKSPRSADRAVQAYNYRFSLSNEPGNIRLPKKPPGYQREEYVDYYRRFMGAGRLNGKATFNAAILPGENHAYPEATWPEREKIIERHKNFALGLMWFLQNDESVRPESRERYRSIGLPLNEFPDNDNIPYEMYVREARRIVGRHVFTEHDNRAAPGVTRPPVHTDSIAFTDWAMDSHDCTWDRSSGFAYDGKLILTEESRPAQIPWRSLLPQGVDNLIVPVCMSTTHVAWGAVRLEPVWMMTGEAAGLAAALARRQGVTPGQLDADLLQRALCEKRHFVSFFNDLESAAAHPAMPAAHYFAARGFFPDYNARLDEPLTESVRRVWGEGLTALREGRFNAMAFAKKVNQAEAADFPKLKRTRGEAMLSMWSAVSGVHRRAAFVEEPRIFIRHGERRRRFIGPHAIELPNGDLLMSAPWGRPPADIAEEIVANHPVPDLYHSKDRGRTWTNAGRLPVEWEHRGFVSDGGVSFLRLADGRLALLLHRHIRGFKGGGLPAICFSSDDGQTWTDPTLLAGPEDEGVWYVMNDRLAQTRSGRLLVPVARAVGKFEGDRDESLVFYSDDAGKTWKSSQPAPLPDGPRGMAEPCVIELKDGRLLMMARGGLGVLLASHSEDGGLTWSRGSPTTLTSSLSSFTLRRLPDGRLIVFYNHAAPSRPGGAFPRCPLAYAVSADEGKTWSAPFVIDDEGLKPASGELPDMAHVYPGITFLEEGMLVLYSSHMTRNRFGYRTGDVPWKPEQLARTGGKVALLAYPPEKLPYPPAKPAGIVLDDDEAEYTGAWKVGERLTPLVGFSYRHDDRPSMLPAVAKFTPEIPVAGKYEVRLLYISNPNRAQNVPITIRSADGERTLTQNQRTPCLVNGVPRSVGVFEFAEGKSGSIEISNKGADGYVIIDGLQLVLEETAKAERANGEDAGFPLKTGAARKATKDSSSAQALRAAARRAPIGSIPGVQSTVFHRVGAVELKLHFFLPSGHAPSDRRSAIVFFFGGGWQHGQPSQFAEHAKHFASRGLVAVCPEYRTQRVHGTTPRECVTDGKAAIRWLGRHAGEWGIDPSRIIAAGGSAGGHVAAATAILADVEADDADRDISCVPQALVLFNPVVDTTATGYGLSRVGDDGRELSPTHHIRAGLPPTIVFHGRADRTVPFANAKRFADAMRQTRNDCRLVPFDGVGHGFYWDQPHYGSTLTFAEEFLADIGLLNSTQASPPKPTLSGVRYGDHPRNILDFWQADSTKPTPVVLAIHGGGWQGGYKERVHQYVDVAALLKEGISVAAPNYRFVQQAVAAGVEPPVMAPLHDAARCLQFIRTKATDWNIDKERIGAAGASAGACSSLWLAFHDDLAKPDNDDPVARESSRLWCAAVISAQTTLDPKQMKEWTPNSRYGGHAFGQRNFAQFLAERESILPWIAEYSPYALVTADDPPVCLLYSTPPALGRAQEDPTHTSNFGVKLKEKCQRVGVDCEFIDTADPETRHVTATEYLIRNLKAARKANLSAKHSSNSHKPAGIVLDDDAAEYTGAWKVGERLAPLVGFSYRHDDQPSKLPAATKFTPDIPVAGKYEVRLLYISNPNRAQNVPITIRCADGEKTLTQNQRTPCLVNGVPRSLGVFEFAKGKSGSIEISNEGADGYVIIDGLQLVPEEAAKTERVNGEDAGFPLKTVAATGPVKIPPPMLLKTAAKPEQVDGKSYDLVVIGGTPGGIACAVRAAREGLNVLLVNHTRHIGGFMTSGAGGWEAPYDGLRSPIYGEMLTGAAAYYRDTYGEGSPQHLASMPSQTSRRHLDRPKIEPRIAELLFNRMVEKEKMLTVLLGHIVTNAERDGTLLKSVTLQPMHGEDHVTVRGKVFADAMYEGDLMAAAGVKTQIGRESREQYGEPHAGVIYTKKRRLEPGRRGYPEVADKGALNIRYNPTSTAGIVEGRDSGEADDSVMAYNYRLILTRDPANRIMVAKPANFDLALAKAASGGGFVPNLPNRKVAWNGGRLVGPQNGYPNGDWPTREAISKRYLDAMLMRLWWMQNDPAAPKRFRDQFEGYGLAADEFPDNHHAPYEIYVREARRLVGRYVFKEQDNVIADGIARTPIHSDSIAITDWPMDSVACLPRNAPGGGTDGILFPSEESRPAQLPYRSLLPVEVDNLLVPVALSASHVGWGSIRLEPVWMQTGEAAGFAAALAVKEQTTPAALNSDTLIRKLAASRVMIAFFNDIDVTSDDSCIPAAQYFSTKGFFASYNARLDEPLTEAVQTVWEEGLTALKENRLDPMDLAKQVHQAEATDSPKLKRTRGAALLDMWCTSNKK